MTLSLPQLPTLQPGVINIDGYQATEGAIQALAVNQADLFGGDIVWIDVGNTCVSTVLTDIAPDDSILDRTTVTRAFTAHQHNELIHQLGSIAPRDTTVFVLPNIDRLYYDDPLLRSERQHMLKEIVDVLQREGQRYQAPILTTSVRDNSPLLNAVDTTVTCEQTSQGVKIATNDHKPMFYEGPYYLQTTLWLWERILKQTITVRNKDSIKVTARGSY